MFGIIQVLQKTLWILKNRQRRIKERKLGAELMLVGPRGCLSVFAAKTQWGNGT
jgi:hypothetical protein